ncbi:MAG: hypothetical protein IKD74_05935 [Clostridia bacterium]|nr:hypothetical protein [Clostridia bacterium]
MEDKKTKIMKLLIEIPYNYLVIKFFDLDSDKLLDEKIDVLTKLKNGKTTAEIKNFYDILEKYPKDKNNMWD